VLVTIRIYFFRYNLALKANVVTVSPNLKQLNNSLLELISFSSEIFKRLSSVTIKVKIETSAKICPELIHFHSPNRLIRFCDWFHSNTPRDHLNSFGHKNLSGRKNWSLFQTPRCSELSRYSLAKLNFALEIGWNSNLFILGKLIIINVLHSLRCNNLIINRIWLFSSLTARKKANELKSSNHKFVYVKISS